MTNVPIVYNIASGDGGPHTLTANFVDAAGNPITGLSGYNFLWGFSDNGAVLAVNAPLASGNPTIQITPTGAAGVVTVNVSATKAGTNLSFIGENKIAVQGAISGMVITSN